mmetsp:Transcript_18711/g.53649  ORF Transcript_18711/g.53649 Transcript_18711/m.53649 type:complete len:440 (+) Transcript_18711:499-1818(+)
MERAEATVLPDRLTKPPLSTWVLSLVGAFAAEPLDHEVSEGSNVDPHPRVLSGLVLRPRRLLHHGGNRLCAGGRIARQTPLRPKATAPKERRCANEPQGGNVGPRRDMPLQVEGRLHERRSAADVAHRKVEGQPETQRAHVRREELRAEVVGLCQAEASCQAEDDRERDEGDPEVAGEGVEQGENREGEERDEHSAEGVQRAGVGVEPAVGGPRENDAGDQNHRHRDSRQPQRLPLAQAALRLVSRGPNARVEGAATADGAPEADEDGQGVVPQDLADAGAVHERGARNQSCGSLAGRQRILGSVGLAGFGRGRGISLFLCLRLLHHEELRGLGQLAAAPDSDYARHECDEVRQAPAPRHHAVVADDGELHLHRSTREHKGEHGGREEEARAQGGAAMWSGLGEVGHDGPDLPAHADALQHAEAQEDHEAGRAGALSAA